MLTSEYPKTVHLKNGRGVVLDPLARDAFDQLHAFFRELPEEDLLFLRHDVKDPALIRQWTEDLDFARVIPLVARDGDRIVGSGSLHLMAPGWMRHVGHMRLVTARSHRRQGLGGLIARDLVALAAERNLEKIQIHNVEDNQDAVRMCESLGFKTVGVLPGMVKDQKGQSRNLVIMLSDVASLSQLLDDWIQDTMIPSYRVPGAGVM